VTGGSKKREKNFQPAGPGREQEMIPNMQTPAVREKLEREKKILHLGSKRGRAPHTQKKPSELVFYAGGGGKRKGRGTGKKL